LLLVFGPSLALIYILVWRSNVAMAPIVMQTRLHRGEMFRTRRFRTSDTVIGRFLETSAFCSLPALIDVAAGRARLVLDAEHRRDGRGHKTLTIAAPIPTSTDHPTRAAAPQTAIFAVGE
jgi:hypothetical protein